MENRIKPVASLGRRYTYAHVVKRCTRVFLELLLYVYVHVGSLLVSGWWWSRRAARGRMVGRTGSQGRVESLLEPWGESACAGDSLFVRVARRKKESRGRECEREREKDVGAEERVKWRGTATGVATAPKGILLSWDFYYTCICLANSSSPSVAVNLESWSTIREQISLTVRFWNFGFWFI